MSKKSIQKVYALTPMQEGMLYHAMLDPHSSSYFTQLELGIQGVFDLEIFEKSVNELIRSYDILRTVFVHQQLQKPRQVVLAERKTKVHYEDISHADEDRQKDHIERYKQDVQRQGFNLAKDILFKVAVFRLDADQLYLVWSNHHIMMDGWSMGVLMKSLFQNYEALRAGRTPANGQGKPYSDYIKWLGKQDNEEAEDYWSERLADFEQPSVLPGRLPEKKDEYVNREYSFTWDEELVARIQQTANRHQVTGPNLFQAIWGIVLSKYNFTNDVVFGTVVSGRPSEINGIETMAGLFINTIPVRVKVDQQSTFADIFTDVQQHAVEAERYDYVPLYEIQKRSALDSSLLNHLVAFENYPLDQELENGSMEDRLGFSIKVESAFEQTSFDFNLIVYPGKTWTVKIKYNSAAFDSAFIERTAGHLTRMMTAAVERPDAFVREHGLVGEEEQRQIVETFNSTSSELPEGMAVHQVFEEQAKRTPASTALVCEGAELTYRELNEAANRLARKLIGQGLQKGETAAIMNDRSADTVAAMLAVLKAGAAYVPLDPALPEDRLRFMAEDSSIRIALAGEAYTKQANQLQVPVLPLEGVFEGNETADNLNLPADPSDLAYIMYTSGSTGKPKGVMIEHKSILRLVKNAGYVPVHEEDRMAQTGAVSFDAGTFEVFGALLNGAALYPVKKETLLDATRFSAFLREQRITTMWLTSPLFNQLAAKDAGMFGTLRHLIIGGDALVPHIVSKVKQASPSLSLWNGYGPTENTTFSTSFLIDREYSGSIPIGKPIGNSTAYIMDEQQRLQPIGAPGELCVGGSGVARGYVNLPELTKKQFLEDPFRPGEKMYRTGDLARWLPDGNIEFLGRIDNQVKVRGFRIELGEIETKLNMAEHVTEAAVIIRKNKADENEICAYFTADREVSVSGLRKTLSQSLPDYMVPAHLIQMDSLPLTPNGKINKKELPAPQSDAVQSEYAAPKTESEKKLAKIWEGILGVKAGVTDNFFMIGGHSLKAMMMTAKIQEHFHKEVPIKVLFEKPTIQELALYLEESESKEEQTFEPIRQAPYQQHYPVSPAQRRMYILNQLGQASTSYNVPAVLLLEGEVNKDRLEHAIQQLISRHEILRTSFDMIDGEVVQTVHKNISFQLEAAKGREEDAEELIKSFIQPFELNRAPLVRSKLIQLEEERHLLLIDMHHIITDGSSTGILIGDLAKIYQGADLELPQIHYKDYAVWQKEHADHQKDEAYWLDTFKGELPVLDLPADFPRPAERSFSGERVMFGLDKQITAQIKSLLSETDTTMYMFLLAAFHVLLSKYASQDDIIVGSPTAGRTHPDLQGVPGMFVNTVALRTAPAGDKTFAQFLDEVKTVSLQAFEHQSYPLEELIEKLPLTRDTSRSPLFSVMFNMQNMEIPSLKLGDLKISSYSMLHHVAKFDLSLEAVEREEEISLSFDYATALFKDETIRRWSSHFVNLIKAAAVNPNVRLSDLEILSPVETAALLEEKKQTTHSGNDTFASLFEKQVQQTPDHPAVISGGNQLSYRELDEQANQLAHHLRAHGAGSEDIVAVVMDRSADLMTAVLGVMKAGAAFLPIDPDTPEERIRYSLEDSGARFTVVNERNMTAIGQYQGTVINIDQADWRNESKERPEPISGPKNLAYIIYTSGTTGKPKGVQIEHRNLTNYVSWFSKEAGLAETDKSVLLSSYAFDLGYTSIFPVLQAGGELHIVPKETYTAPDQIGRYIKEHGITYIKLTPSLFHTMVNTASFTKEPHFESLRLIVLGGEKIIPADVLAFSKVYQHTEFINHYGPTEATIGAIAGRVDLSEPDTFAKRPTIGRPIANTGALVLNESLKLVPSGASGQLYITGQGLARGYLSRPQLTSEKFVENPYAPGSLMYKTGDVVRRLADGTIEFIGRADDQVKIRGYRIEPKEIETIMLSLSEVQEAVVLAVSEGGLQELCAYYTSDQAIEKAELRKQLSQILPSHMIPAFFVQVDAIPLTANGKTDRNALPKPNAAQSGYEASAAPETALEESLCRIWQKTLGIEAIGIDDNFFDLGGHSLKGMMLIANIQAELEKTVPLKALFEQPTVRQLAAYMEESAASGGYHMLKPADKQDVYPLSSAQKRMYVLNQLDRQTISYNMPSVLLMEGELHISRLRESLNQLVNRHESLRTSFPEADGEPVQRIVEEASIDLHVFDAEEGEAEQKIKEFIRPFDLSGAPLIRAALLRIADQKHLLLLDMHHIIADGVSRGIFVKELALLYKGEQLPEPKLHYKDFAVWQNEAGQKERMKEHEQYWLSVLSGELPELDLPLDYTRPPVQSFEGDTVRFRTESGTAKAIEKLLAETGTTLHMVLHTVFHVFLSKISGQRDIVIGSVTAGRTNADVQNMPGMFVNTLALRMEAREEQTFAELLEQAKETNLSALEHQEYPFEDLVNQLDLPRDMSRNPLFNVMVTTENPDKEQLELQDLTISPYEAHQGTSKFDLTLGGFADENGIGLQLEYATDLFSRETAEQWSEYVLRLLRAVAENPNQPLSGLSLVNETEKQTLLEAWRGKTLPVPTDKTVHQLFEETAQRHKDQPAVTYNGQSWTYGELNAKANRLARILIDCGIGADERVGILTKPSLEMSAAVLGVLKAGAAFVPIDPDYPDQRIEYILQDSGATLLLKQEGITVPDSYTGEVILLDGNRTILSLPLDENDEENPQTDTTADHLAYMIYTSGTTGQPKGVMIEHHALVNLCFWHHDAFGMTAEDRSAKYAGFGFDASIWEMFPTWTIGAELHVIDEAIRLDITRLNDYFETHNVTITFLPTQLAEQFMELENTSLRVLLTGGDKLKRAVKQPYTIVNNYGPTENTVVATSTEINPEEGSLSIGRAIANTRVYILSESHQVQPEGVAGELCVAGRGLARGYLNREDETAKRFVADPFVPGERMYKTGDLVKWTGGGIEYIGRIDQQVKVRGYRIELSEIEVQLAQLSEVQDAAVTAVKDKGGNTAIAAYVTPETADIEALKSALKETLPDYMIPAFWVTLNELPVTANGKVDRKALPEPDIEAGSGEYKAPSTDMEELLAGIWQDVLGISEVGVGDNFFSLGGDSIKGIQMASRLNQHGWKLEMKDLFQHPTIEELTQYVERAEGKQANQGPVEGEVILTPIQRWFFEKNFTNKHHWNQSVMLHSAKGFDPERVEKTLQALIEHHDTLRMVYREENGDIIQAYKRIDECEVSFEIVDLYGSDEDMLKNQIKVLADSLQSSLDLQNGPLLKGELYRTEAGDHLLIAVHHLVVDGVSWRILLEDFASGYVQAENEEKIVFPQKTNSFKDWAEELAAFSQSAHLLQQAEYWAQIDAEEVSAVPKDDETEERIVKHTSSVICELNEEDTKHLLTDVHQPYGTEINDILLSALGLTMKEWTDGVKIGINLEGHGREDIIPNVNISRTVGWFTAQYPVVLDMSETDVSAVIKAVKENLRRVPDKGVGYGILRYFTEQAEAQGFTPEISFNYLGQFDSEVKTDFFEPSAFDMGRQVSEESEALYALSFSGMIRNGRFVLSCSYNEKEYERATVEAQMERFKENLLLIIRHCTEKEDKEFTPSDFSAGDLEMDEMGDIFDMLEENLK
ncbi:surfactin non-ribosomal peptide synthetase SrfAB [Bacillus sp. XT-2]|uniref:surfactin non-ribosomal peptide synthetase SrfAB n=1 Tax=Bacillus sp. XT-2 TaxID=2856852 RepID=UPI00398C3429|nr:surfactin non-ribosomal peptide synthetase SrfAB [Bacillus sp. XT-2]